MKYRGYLCLAFFIRIVLVMWGTLQDSLLNVQYTDVDYWVFTDAARYVTQGESPYLRPTYRYTPLLAWILSPNVLLDIHFGKLLFSAVDVINGGMIFSAIKKQSNHATALFGSCLWLFNPITFVVSTRGNAETLITLMVLITLHYHNREKYFTSGIFFGLAVHLKIYPIIYSLVLYFNISSSSTLVESLQPTVNRLKFVTGFIFSLLLSTGICYYLYDWPFLQETYLYHITRQDVRHNFSPYFYFLYLDSEQQSRIMSLITFLPQFLMIVFLSWRFRARKDLNLALFQLTYGFVTFNKVVTAQYFMWYISLLPLCLHRLSFSVKKSMLMIFLWFAAVGIWLGFAYLLEFHGESVFIYVWLASLLFFSVNIYKISQCLLVERVKVQKSLN